MILTLQGHNAGLNCATFSPDGKRIVTASGDRTAKVWDAQTGQMILTFKEHTNNVTTAAFSPDGNRIVTGDWDFTAKVWDAQTGRVIRHLEGT